MGTKPEVIVEESYGGRPQVVIAEREHPCFEARIAIELVQRWGIVAAEIDGEDSAGRSKVRRLTPEELVSQACETSSRLADAFRERGWMIELPSVLEAIEAKKEEERKRAEERRSARAT